jgi:hypothetical protein
VDSIRDEGIDTKSLRGQTPLADLSELRSTGQQLGEALEVLFDDFERLCAAMAHLSSTPDS